MKKLHPVLFIFAIIVLGSCAKEYSLENGGIGSGLIGADCRISRIEYGDSTTGIGQRSLTATINSGDSVTNILDYDSISNTINFLSAPIYINDTVYIDPDEYFVQNHTTKLIIKLHGLLDPTDFTSPAIDIDYTYNTGGYLIKKQYSFSAVPGFPYQQVDYVYSGGNLTSMTNTNLTTGDLITNAAISYSVFLPKNFVYLFPDELAYPSFTQFFNFGTKNISAPASVVVRTYDPGNVVSSTSTSVFSNYVLSPDQYVLSCNMSGSDLPSLPAMTGRLTFSYHCK